MAAVKVELTFLLRNGDTGETDEFSIPLSLSDDVSSHWLSKLKGEFVAEDLFSFLRHIYGNPEYDGSDHTGEFYVPIFTKLSNRSYRVLGWLDVMAIVIGLKIGGKALKFDDGMLESLASQIVQLSPDGFMYIAG